LKLVHWLVTLPAAALAVIFAVSNRDGVAVTFWPLPVRLEAPLYLVVLATFLAGFLIGELVAWINGGRARRLARERARRIAELEAQLATAAKAPPQPALPALPAVIAPAREVPS
jgi:lipopolysaccharide assembly protein A